LNADNSAGEHFWAGRNINGYYAYHLFVNFAFWMPVYALFFLDRGLGYGAILFLYAINTGIQTALELPSGMLADRWGRKPVLMLGACLQAVAFALIAFGGNSAVYIIAMAMHGAALAAVSGCDAAFIYDSLTAAGREREFRKIEGRAYMYNLVGWGTGGLLGGLLAAKSLTLPFTLSVLTSLLAFLVMATCIEPPRVKRPIPASVFIKDALKNIRSNRPIGSIVVFASLMYGLLLVAHKFSQPYMLRADVDLKLFGVVYFIWLMAAAVSSNYSERIEKRLGFKAYFFILPLLVGGVLIYQGLFQNMWGIGLVVLQQFVWGSLRPEMNQIINREAASAWRATLLSCVGFGSSVVYILTAAVLGPVADALDFPTAMFWLGIITLAVGWFAAAWFIRSSRASVAAPCN